MKMAEAGLNHDPLVGATLGGLYHVERLIGVGGMGRVYEATHTHLGKAYAVKVLPEGRADKPEATERFLREAKSATKIEHEHIVKIVNFDSDDEHRLFIVMELLEGENLADRLDQGALPSRRSDRDRQADRRGPSGGPRRRDRAPRPEARKHLPHPEARARFREGARLRDLEDQEPGTRRS